jgi:SAM-dependent methyltransferase
MMEQSGYQEKVKQQIDQYREVADIHELPEIFHYWSNKYIRPRLNQVLEADSITDFYANVFLAAAQACSVKTPRFVSIGSGDCSVEINVAKRLIELGLANFSLECLELSPVLAERAATRVSNEKVSHLVFPNVIDINAWQSPQGRYCGVMANHSLHHIVELERVFESIRTGLMSNGLFVTNDMIGRNGHMRWPETLKWIEAIWAFLPDRYKYNQQLKRLEREFVNWDCSKEGFEGIRAQDILPLLIRQFHFQSFLAFGGLIDVFVDRSFGHNFDATSQRDRALIDFIQLLNDQLIDTGSIKPTTMFAVLCVNPTVTRQWRHWSPQFSLRVVQ